MQGFAGFGVVLGGAFFLTQGLICTGWSFFLTQGLRCFAQRFAGFDLYWVESFFTIR